MSFTSDGVELLGSDVEQISLCKDIGVDHNETVDEGTGETLPTAALVMRVLGGKELEVGMPLEDLVQLCNVNLATVVEARIQTFENGLRRQVHFL